MTLSPRSGVLITRDVGKGHLELIVIARFVKSDKSFIRVDDGDVGGVNALLLIRTNLRPAAARVIRSAVARGRLASGIGGILPTRAVPILLGALALVANFFSAHVIGWRVIVIAVRVGCERIVPTITLVAAIGTAAVAIAPRRADISIVDVWIREISVVAAVMIRIILRIISIVLRKATLVLWTRGFSELRCEGIPH